MIHASHPSHAVDRLQRRRPWHRVGRGRVAKLRVLERWRLPWAVSYGSAKEYSGGEEMELRQSTAVGGGALHELRSLRTHVAVGSQCRQWLRSRRRTG
jgi:hypothetical protein